VRRVKALLNWCEKKGVFDLKGGEEREGREVSASFSYFSLPSFLLDSFFFLHWWGLNFSFFLALSINCFGVVLVRACLFYPFSFTNWGSWCKPSPRRKEKRKRELPETQTCKHQGTEMFWPCKSEVSFFAKPTHRITPPLRWCRPQADYLIERTWCCKWKKV